MKSPIELLWVIMDKSKADKVSRCLREHEVTNTFVLMGKGTAKSTLGDIFSFGIIDRDVVCSIVSVDKADIIMSDLNNIINPHGPTGVIFTTPLDAISSDLYKMILGGK